MTNQTDKPFQNPRGWHLAQRFLRFLLFHLIRLDVKGLEHLPDKGPAIITPNHVNWLDVFLIPAFSKVAPVTFAGEKWARAPLVNRMFRHFGQAIFVNRGAPDRKALMAAMEVLKQGRVLGLAPEGTRSHDGILRKGHDGAAWLASRTGALIVPVAMWGHEDIIRSQWLRFQRPIVHFHVGKPYRLPPEARQTRSRDLDPYTEMIMRRIAEMLPPERRGYYA